MQHNTEGVPPNRKRGNVRKSAAGKEMPEPIRQEIWDNLGRSARLVPADLSGALEIVEGVVKVGRKWGEIGIEAATLIYRAHIYRFLGREEEADDCFHQAESLVPRITNQYDLFRLLDSIAMEYIRRDEPARGLELLERAEKIIHALGIRSLLKGNYHSRAIAYFKMGAFEEALEYNLRTLRLQQEFSTPLSSTIMTVVNIGSVYSKLHDYAKGEEYFQRAIQMVREDGGRELDSLATCLMNLGSNCNLTGRYREALPYLREAFDLWTELNDRMYAAESLAELGVASLHLGELDDALGYFDHAWSICEDAVVKGLTPAFILQGKGQVHQRRGELHQARDHYLRSLEICRQFGLPEEEMGAHLLLSDLYPLLEDYCGAYEHHKKAMAIREQIAGAELHRAAAAVELRHARLAAEREQELLHLRAEKAEHEAEFKTKELSMMALQMTQWNQAFRVLRETVEPYMRQGRGQTKAVAAAVLRNITAAVESNPGWRVFEEQFERVHSEFITRLRERCPRLTSSEIRICVLIRMNLSTKQIAEALFASELTVKKHRANIRRKLGLQGDDNLNGLLFSL